MESGLGGEESERIGQDGDFHEGAGGAKSGRGGDKQGETCEQDIASKVKAVDIGVVQLHTKGQN